MAPIVIGVFAGVLAIGSLYAALQGKNQDAFLGAVVGSSIALYGSLLVQYLVELLRSWREHPAHRRREAGVIAALMSELGQIKVALESNVAGGTYFAAPTEVWDTLRLQLGELWTANTVFRLSATYIHVRLVNEVIHAHKDTGRPLDAKAVAELEKAAKKVSDEAESLRQRFNELGE